MEIPEGRVHRIARGSGVVHGGGLAQLVHQVDRIGGIEHRSTSIGSGAVIELPLLLGAADRLAVALFLGPGRSNSS
ncbi:MAG: hypothetical protein ABR96_03855 [cyanobacterium BACL30 MAG-120619-bin27]|nr:MAG: hypothetical protein ABR96_03855 [cyanobacterium BACL30 MAG-120619-bin27]